MAGLDTSIYSSIKAPEQTSLSDMLGLATGAQKYKQEAFKTQKGYQDVLNQSLSALSQDQDIINGTDPNAIVKKIAQQRDFAIRNGVPQSEAETGAAHLIAEAYRDPSSVIGHLGNVRRSMIAPAQQQANITGQQTVEGKDIYGNPTAIVTNPDTGAKVQIPLQFAQKQGGGQMRYEPGETKETVDQFIADRNLAQNAVIPAKTGLTNIQKIREVLPMAETGDYAGLRKMVQSLGGSIAGDTKAEIAAAAYDIINKNVADLALSKSTALGSKFATQIESVKDSLANAEKNPTAIKASLQQLEPLLQHVTNYQTGLEKTIANHGGNVQYKRVYDNAVNEAYDPQTLMAYNEYKAHGASGLQKYAKEHNLNPETLIQNLTKYNNLVTKGM
jgi:hypothetical protein